MSYDAMCSSYEKEIAHLRAALAEAERERDEARTRIAYLALSCDGPNAPSELRTRAERAEADLAELECRYETHIDEIMARTHKAEAGVAAARAVIRKLRTAENMTCVWHIADAFLERAATSSDPAPRSDQSSPPGSPSSG